MSSNETLQGAEGPADNGESAGPVRKVSASDLNRQERIKAIHQARQDVRAAMLKVGEYEMRLDRPTVEGNRYLRQAVEAYILELEPFVLKDDVPKTDDGKDFYTEVELGAVVIEPPADLLEKTEETYRDGDLEAVMFPIRGLRNIPEAPREYSHTFVGYHNPKYEKPTEIERTVSRPISRPVLKRAYRFANHFAHQVGLDVDLEEDRGPMEI